MRTIYFVFILCVTSLFVTHKSAVASGKTYTYYPHASGYYTCPDLDGVNSGIYYQRFLDVYGRVRFRRISSPIVSQNQVSYSGREGLERLASRMAEDALWLQSFEKIVQKLPEGLGSQLYRQGLNDVYGRYGGTGLPGGLSGYSYRASSVYGSSGQGYTPGYPGAAYTASTVDPLTTIKELTSYAARLSEQAHRYGAQGMAQGQQLIDGVVMGLVNAERIRAAGDVAVAAVEAASSQERSTESSYEYTGRQSPVGDAPSAPAGEWLQVIASRCISCHSPAELGGKGQNPLLHGEISDDLKGKIFEQVVSQKMPKDSDGNHSPLSAEEFQKLVMGVSQH